MTARKKAAPTADIETVDLISLLTVPGQEGRYEAEVALAAPGEIVEEAFFFTGPDEIKPALGRGQATSSRVSGKAADKPVVATSRPAAKADKADNSASLDSLKELMSGKKTAAKGPERPLPELTPVADDSLDRIIAEIAGCEKCELHKTRNKTVPGVGSPQAKLVFIGEAPGADEDASGIPFVGRAGQHLDRILNAAGFKREEVFICNILKCRPPGNRNPSLEEMHCCTPFLQRQLALLKPALIACLGNVAIKYVIGSDTPGITRVHGEWFKSIFAIPAMAMYHPSYLIRSDSREPGSPNWQMWQDIKKLKKRYDELK